MNHALITPPEDWCVVVIPDLLVFHHVLQITDDGRSPEIRTASGNQRLVHVQRYGSGAPDSAEVDRAFTKKYRPVVVLPNRLFYGCF